MRRLCAHARTNPANTSWLSRLLEQKKALEAKISREQGLLRERERKARTRRLIEYGGLVAIAKLDQEDKGTVLGLLLEGARRLAVDGKAQQRWKALGDRELAIRAVQMSGNTIQGTQGDASALAPDTNQPGETGDTVPDQREHVRVKSLESIVGEETPVL